MNKYTLQAIINAFNTASTETHRKNLCSVGIKRKDESRVTVFATNGHFLTELDCADELLANDIKEGSYFFDRTKLAALKLILKDTGKYMSTVEHSILDTQPKTLKIGGAINVISVLSNNCNYPNTDQVKPKTDETFVEVCFNAEYLYDIAKSLAPDFKNIYSVRLRINPNKDANHSPIEVTTNNGGYAVLMPVRM
jgi:hypothetical protein